MHSEAPHRLSITELELAPTVIADAAAVIGSTRGDVVELIDAANLRLARRVGLSATALEVRGDGLFVEDVAGLLRLSPRLELEIAPKFLGTTWSSWREDFFLIATLSRFGTLLPVDRLAAGFGERGDLATLVARSLIDQYWQHHRRPLRTYHRKTWRDFAADGDIDPEELVVIDPDGFQQTVVTFTRANPYNATMFAAASELLGEVRDAETRQQLLRVRDALAPQVPQMGRRRPTRVPSRHRRWQTLYELSEQVLTGFGVNLADRNHQLAPGYVLRTSKAWEDVLVAGMRAGLPNANVRAQHGFPLGTRNGRAFRTTPDIAIELAGERLLADAKYKSRVGQESARVVAEDVYEGLAFLRAAECSRLLLLYPAPSTDEAPEPAGTTHLFETIEVDDKRIYAFHVECRGLAKTNGFRDFANHLAAVVPVLVVA